MTCFPPLLSVMPEESVHTKAPLNGEICWRGNCVRQQHLLEGQSLPRRIEGFNGPTLFQGICIFLLLPWFKTAPEDPLLWGRTGFQSKRTVLTRTLPIVLSGTTTLLLNCFVTILFFACFLRQLQGFFFWKRFFPM